MATTSPGPRKVGTLTVIIGLCGSGKSWVLDRLDVEVKLPHDGFASDRRHFDHVVDGLRSDKSCAVIEIAHCDPIQRTTFEREIRIAVPHVSIRYICFENDLRKANENCRRRKDGRDLERLRRINDHYTEVYSIPAGAEVRPITLRPE